MFHEVRVPWPSFFISVTGLWASDFLPPNHPLTSRLMKQTNVAATRGIQNTLTRNNSCRRLRSTRQDIGIHLTVLFCVMVFALRGMRYISLGSAQPMKPAPLHKTTASLSVKASTDAAPRCCCCAVVYISEGRDNSLLNDLAGIAEMAAPGSAGLIRQFRDPQYHRTGFTIGGNSPAAVARASVEVGRRALQLIDLRLHEASHPRIGVVDHISVHPLGGGGRDDEGDARQAGLTIATALGEELGVPVLLYGDLKNGKRLAEVRRSTPYFSSRNLPATIEADVGPNEVDPSRGIATVGCTPLVTNFNILLSTGERRLAAKVTKSIRERDGGLPWVESLTLRREDGTFESACNLLRPRETTPAMVLAVAEEQVASLGIRVVNYYETGLSEEGAMSAISRLISEEGTST